MYNISIGNINKEEVLIIPVYEDEKTTNCNSLSKRLDFFIEKHASNLKQGEIVNSIIEKDNNLCYVVFLGLGSSNRINKENIRKSFGKLGKFLKDIKSKNIKIDLTLAINNDNKLNIEDIITSLTEGLILSAYTFDKYISKSNNYESKDITLYLGENLDSKHLNNNIKEATNISNIIYKVRDLINEPPNIIYPQTLAQEVLKLSKVYNFDVDILEEDEMKVLGMNAFLSVSRGSSNKGKLIVIRHMGNENSKEILGLVGKGITYDSGGYSIKPTETMINMKSDMGGAASVIGIMSAIALNKLNTNVVAVIPVCENIISNESYKPGEIITSMSGKTIEVTNVDAEGRLILADAITYIIKEEKVSQVIDIATLTHTVKATFGDKTAAAITNDVSLYEELEDAMKISDEKIWQMPNYQEYRELLNSNIADIKNYNNTHSKVISAGMFIQEFVEEKPWIHIDISGTSFIENSIEYCPKGGTGFSVRTMYEFIKNRANRNQKSIIVADWIFSEDNVIYGSIENEDLLIKDNSSNNNILEMKKTTNCNLSNIVNWHNDSLEFKNSKNKGVYFKTVKNSYIDSLEFNNGYTIEVILEIARDYNPWMGILTREGSGKEIGKTEGETEILATLSYNDAFQWAMYPLNKSSNYTNWSMNATNEQSRGGFHHLAIVNDGKKTKMYLNGTEELRNPREDLVGICRGIDKGWLIGASMWDNKIDSLFSGKLKRIRISESPLKDSDCIITNHIPTVNLKGTNKISKLKATNENNTLVIIPDSQYMGESNPKILTEINKWIVENKEDLNIKMVMHVGDISENSTDREFKDADEYFKILDKGNCDYMTTLGNHDYFDKGKNYEKYFGEFRYKDKVGFEEDSFYNLNMYRTIQVGNYEYLFISLNYSNIEDSIKWATKIIAKNENKPTIIFTHDAYNSKKGEFIRTEKGSIIWEELVNINNSIFMVISGHEFGVNHRVSYNNCNKEVIEMLVNYQDYPYGGNGWIRLLEIDEQNGVYAKTISPWVNKIVKEKRKEYDLLFLNSDKDEFFIELNLNKRFIF